MTTELLLAFIAFAFVTSVTPGPNNMMLLASGVNFGLRRSLPHMFGISLGFMLLVASVGLGLGQLFEQVPLLHSLLRYMGAAYLLYLAWKIARSGAPQHGEQPVGKPFTFLQAAAFQWVNPKAWIMAIGVIATYTPREDFFINLVLAALVLGIVNYPSVSVWTLFGSAVGRALRSPQALRRFNWCMAALLLLSLYPVLADSHG